MTEENRTTSRQIELELEMHGLGQQRYEAAVTKAKTEGTESRTTYGQHLLKMLTEPVTLALDEYMKGGRAISRAAAAKLLKQTTTKAAAYIALKHTVDHMHRPQTFQKLAVEIARAIESEAMFTALEDAAPDSAKWVERKAKSSASPRHARGVLTHTMTANEVDWQSWAPADCLHLGKLMIEIIANTTGIVKVYRRNGSSGTDTPYIVEPTQEALDKVKDHISKTSLMSPMFMPMIEKPKAWTTIFNGGYHHPLVRRRAPLVKTSNKAFLEELRNMDLSNVLDAVNAIQNTAWRINTRVLSVMQHFNEAGQDIAGIVTQADIILPPKPLDIAENEEARRAWAKQAAAVYEEHTVKTSKVLQFAKLMWLAEKFANEERIYFPMQLDFRGRIYSIPTYLQPQGNDAAKALLIFAEGKALGSQAAVEELAITVANLWGEDKLPLMDRVAWVKENEAMILRCASDPLSNTEWADADSPWLFLAACYEWQGYVEQGLDYVCTFPCHRDATCSGIQHFSAMLRDEVGGKSVNLIPQERPADVYMEVAAKTTELLRLEASTGGDNADLAKRWLHFGIKRSTAKRPTMVLPYGGTRMAFKTYIFKDIKERIAAGEANVFRIDETNDGTNSAAMFLASVMWKAIGKVVIGARHVMDWLRTAARLASAEGLPIHWPTPDGFRVLQAYPEYKHRRIQTVFNGSLVQFTLTEPTSKFDKARQANGIAPNFVHSMDAALLRVAVCYAMDNGVSSFATIHDSIGTNPTDTAVLNACLRRAFVDLYQTDVLAEFRKEIDALLSTDRQAELPAIPEKGTLDLNVVLESDFFFS